MYQDSVLIDLCQRGHPAGFTRLVTTYQERVYRTAYAYVQNREDARDLTQEAFLRTVRAIDSLDANRPLWPWLRRVITNLALNLLKQRATDLSLDQLPEAAVPHDRSGEPSWTLIDLEQAMTTIPAAWRVVLTLRHMEDLPYDEIARITGLPIGTVKTYLFRGRRLLRERLALQED